MAPSCYRQKADECLRLAKAAVSADARERLAHESRLWLQIAEIEERQSHEERKVMTEIGSLKLASAYGEPANA